METGRVRGSGKEDIMPGVGDSLCKGVEEGNGMPCVWEKQKELA